MSRSTATNKKNIDKGKSSSKKATLKEELVIKDDTPSPIKITYYKRIALIELSKNNAISVALLRNALKQKFLVVERVYKNKGGE